MRALLVALLVATPSFLLPLPSSNATDIVALLAIIAALLTFAEYSASYPSIVEFRDAPPINRIRFAALMAMVISLTAIYKYQYEPTHLTSIFAGLGRVIGEVLDFPYSPVRLVLVMLPDDTTATTMNLLRAASGVAYGLSLLAVVAFLGAVRLFSWPIGNGAFNVWVNLPLFDPTTGGDVVFRLQRDGRINVVLGLLLPFVIPALVQIGTMIFSPLPLNHPQSQIWLLCAWAFLPASMLMRGIAMLRIAELIEEKRRRAYANAEALQAA
ncbi:hypothetical protein LCL97_19885 [Seohaeicola saemankumensis]|nr:hypothetical protein [Seohaeicola saemankumensis]MCA0873097.1 hypothetical protein [Seohaeicola saemankumensis]